MVQDIYRLCSKWNDHTYIFRFIQQCVKSRKHPEPYVASQQPVGGPSSALHQREANRDARPGCVLDQVYEDLLKAGVVDPAKASGGEWRTSFRRVMCSELVEGNIYSETETHILGENHGFLRSFSLTKSLDYLLKCSER